MLAQLPAIVTRVDEGSRMNISKIVLIGIAVGGFAALTAQAQGLTGTDLNNLDKNGDGAISAEEYKSFSEFSFDQLDTDKNGGLTSSEMKAQGVGDYITDIDSNGDGMVSKDEFSGQMAKDFADADKDGDGVLN